MLWPFLIAVTIGAIIAIPATLQAAARARLTEEHADDAYADHLSAPVAALGLGLLCGGLAGLFVLRFDTSRLVAWIVALTIALAAAALQPEIAGMFRRRAEADGANPNGSTPTTA